MTYNLFDVTSNLTQIQLHFLLASHEHIIAQVYSLTGFYATHGPVRQDKAKQSKEVLTKAQAKTI